MKTCEDCGRDEWYMNQERWEEGLTATEYLNWQREMHQLMIRELEVPFQKIEGREKPKARIGRLIELGEQD